MLSQTAVTALMPVSRLEAAISGQHFNLTVADGGAIQIIACDTGEHLTTITSGFSAPGPVWNEFNLSSKTSDSWKVTACMIDTLYLCYLVLKVIVIRCCYIAAAFSLLDPSFLRLSV